MNGTILIGYDVERASESSHGFLSGAKRLHAEMGFPWTVFLTGRISRESDA